MSRTGKNPVNLPDKVEVNLSDSHLGQTLKVKGPKGELHTELKKIVKVKKENGQLVLTRANDEKQSKSLHGTYRALIHNMVLGVTEGFTKELDIIGVGYRAQMQGNKLVLQMGYSHQVEIEPKSKDLKIEVDKQTRIKISGINKQEVGDLAAEIREVRAPEPYKGKGIKYTTEVIRKKAGKSAGAKTTK